MRRQRSRPGTSAFDPIPESDAARFPDESPVSLTQASGTPTGDGPLAALVILECCGDVDDAEGGETVPDGMGT